MIIPEFKTEAVLRDIAKRYEDWHTPGGTGSRKNPIGQPGSGREFLQFHRSLLDDFFAWNAVHPVVEGRDIIAWTAVPSELKVPETGWPHPWEGLDLAVAENRVSTNLPPFANEDELGILIETTIINWIHSAVAAAPAFNLAPAEKAIITSPLRALESTWFYKIYGLAQRWWNRFLYPESDFKENNDFRMTGKEANDFKENNDFRMAGKEANDFKENNDFRAGGKEANDFKENNDFRLSGSGFKEIVDNPGGREFKEIFDTWSKRTAVPSFLNNLLARIRVLEARLEVKKSPFIKPFQHPPVGKGTIRSKKKRDR
jgi:hypothetical protein